MNKYILILLLVFSIGIAGRLLTNGDFEQPLNVGWTSGIGTLTTSDTIDRAIDFHPDPDFEARVKKYDATHAKLSQTVTIPTINDLQFSAYAKLYAYEYNSTTTYWAAAAVVLRYLDYNNNLLAETRISYKSPHSPWVNTNTVHLIQIHDPNNWYTHTLNISTELTNFTGVNINNIKKIEVALFDTTDGC
jgi:hypothetical protein